ncbi:MAG: hypothetical protein M3373_03095 [Gemmatimonadota bacterium]|nr:hypothetical protein [Gemmatimonadota bacterium]
MSDGTSGVFLFATFILLIAVVTIAMWRLRRHVRERAQAEQRMAVALEELHRLTARLKTQQQALAAAAAEPRHGAEGLGGEERGSATDTVKTGRARPEEPRSEPR